MKTKYFAQQYVGDGSKMYEPGDEIPGRVIDKMPDDVWQRMMNKGAIIAVDEPGTANEVPQDEAPEDEPSEAAQAEENEEAAEPMAIDAASAIVEDEEPEEPKPVRKSSRGKK